jgi:GMP synthase-like glutamine amidotransferase
MIQRRRPIGVILSGGPQSVMTATLAGRCRAVRARRSGPGICQMQLMAHSWRQGLPAARREYGRPR